MDGLALAALIGLLGTLVGSIITYQTTIRRVNADVQIALLTLESEEETDDRKALRDFQNAAITRCEQELVLCRQKLELSESTKNQSLGTLEEAIEIIKGYREASQQLNMTGGQS